MTRHAPPSGWHLHPQLADDTHPLAHWPLCDDAHHPWLILVPRVENAIEIVDLDPDQQATLIREIDRASRALQTTMKPHKLNVAALGNVVPQLHVHIIARYLEDIAWPRPVWGMAAAASYSPEALIARVDILRAALTA
jgi:diadenosine tetraphosphate (Ap4A) HIT family hydrolase